MGQPESFGQQLKQRRKALDLTQADLARQASYALITIKKLESGSLRPSRQMLERLAELLLIDDPERDAFISLGRAVAPNVLAPPIDEADVARRNPYKGLRAFEEADTNDFFGHEALTQRLLERLADGSPMARFLAVVGPSGSGKSSVVRAGLVPALRSGALRGATTWVVAAFSPGANPLVELEDALLAAMTDAPPSLSDQLAGSPDGLLRVINHSLPADEAHELLLIVDQFEELFTLTTDERARDQFCTLLITALLDPHSRLRVVVTLRADFFDRPLQSVLLGKWFLARTELVIPLTPSELERTISEPAERAGLRLEQGLVTTMLSDIAGQPGRLPLLQYTLTELFEQRQGRLLTLEAYQHTGGVVGALSRRAETLYQTLEPHTQVAARQLFLRLVAVGDSAEDTRRRIALAELTLGEPDRVANDALQQVLDIYGRYRLLTFDHDSAVYGPTVELAHEALLGNHGWPRLRTWLDQSRESLRIQRRLAAAAAEWDGAERHASFLAADARLSHYEELTAQGGLVLNAVERDYIQASCAARLQLDTEKHERRERELTLAQETAHAQYRAANRLRWLVVSLVLFLGTALGLSAVAFGQRQVAEVNLARSEAQRLAAEALTLYQRGGSSDLIALLSIRSLQVQPTEQGQAALDLAATLPYPQRRFTGSPDLVRSLAISPDGRTFLTGRYDASAQLWDMQTGALLHTFVGHTGAVATVGFAADGRTAVTGSADGTTRLWDVQTGDSLHTLVGHTGSVVSAAFTPDGQVLLTGSADGTARLWATDTGTMIRSLQQQRTQIVSVAIAPNGALLAIGSADGTIRLQAFQDGRPLITVPGHSGAVNSVTFAPSGNLLLSSSDDGTARLWDLQSMRELVRLVGHRGAVNAAAFAPDGATLATAGDDATTRLWEMTTGTLRDTFTNSSVPVVATAFAPDGAALLSAAGSSVWLWDVPARPLLAILAGHSSALTSAVFASDGQRVISGSEDRTALLWDLHTAEVIQRFSGHTDAVLSVALQANNLQAITGSADGSARLWDVQTGRQLQRFPHEHPVVAVAGSPDSLRIATVTLDGSLQVWDAQSGRRLWQSWDRTFTVAAVQFSTDGAEILASNIGLRAQPSNDQLFEMGTEIRRWMSETGEQGVGTALTSLQPKASFSLELGLLLTDWRTHTGEQLFAPDGQYLLAAGHNFDLYLWDTREGRLRQQFRGHTDRVTGLAIGPGADTIFTSSEDGTARVWDVSSGEILRQLDSAVAIRTVAYDPQGNLLLTGDSEGVIRLWYRSPSEAVRRLCSVLLRDLSPAEHVRYNIAGSRQTCPQPS